MSDSLVRFRQTPHAAARRSVGAAALALITALTLTACGSEAPTGSAGTSTPVAGSSAPSSSASSAAPSSSSTSSVSSAGTGASGSATSSGSPSSAAGLGSECAPAGLQTLAAGTLTIATSEPAFEPWMVDNDPTNGKGYESAVAYAVADKLGYPQDKVTWTRVGFDEAIAKPDGFDFDINQFSDTADRRKQVDFSSGYYDVTQTVITVKGSPVEGATTLAELKNAKLGAMSGTTSLQAIDQAIQPADRPAIFKDNALGAQALQNGQIDALVVDLPTAFYMVGAQLTDGAIVGQLPGTASAQEQLALLLPKDSPLTSCVSQAVDALRADGTLAALNTQWLSGKGTAPVLK